MVQFFEAHEKEIFGLESDVCFFFKVNYFNALFDIEEYQKVIDLAGEILEYSILYNIHFFQGEDIFRKTLFKKAKALAAMHEYAKAELLAKQLLQMAPRFRPYQKLLRKCLNRQRPLYIKRLFAAGVLLYLISVLLIVFNLLVVETFHEENLNRAEIIRFGIFIFAIIIILFAEGWHLYATRSKVSALTRQAIEKRENRSG